MKTLKWCSRLLIVTSLVLACASLSKAQTYTDLCDFDRTGHGPSQPGDFLWRLVRRVDPADRYAGHKVKRSEVLALVLLL
jgi:hypothetical protein